MKANKDKTYPIDIYGIKKIGIEKWFNHYYTPVTGKEYYGLVDKVSFIYLSLLSKSNNNEILYSIGSANIKIIQIVSTYLIELLTLSRLKMNGYEYVVGKERVEIQEYISMCHSPSLSGMKLIGEQINSLNYQEKIKNILRVLKYNCELPHLMGKKLLNSISNPHFLIGDRAQQEVVAFCKENNISPIHLHPLLFAKKNTSLVDGFQHLPEMEEFVNEFLSKIKESYLFVSETDFVRLKVHVIDYFRNSLLLFYQNLTFMKKFKLRPLLVSGLGRHIHRIFCSAWRYAGGKVIGFSHGRSYCHHYMPRIFNDLSMVDLYVASSQGHKEIVNQAAKDFMPDYKIPNIIHLRNNTRKSLFSKLQNNTPVNKIKKVMLMGGLLSGYFYIDTEYHPFAFLYNDLKLIKILRKAGYYVIYKPCFYGLNETKNIFETYVDEVIIERFEDVYNHADCIFWPSPYSTTFGFALLSNKPIVFLNVKGNIWYPRALELLRKRCSVVKADAVDGKIVFDEKDVLDAVENSLENINYDILYEFAF